MVRVMASEGSSGTAAFLSVFDFCRRAAGQPLGLPTAKFDERSGNVYENKGFGKNVMAGADIAFERLMRHPGFVRLRTGFRREQSENVYENKGSLGQTPPNVRSSADLRVSREGRTAADVPT